MAGRIRALVALDAGVDSNTIQSMLPDSSTMVIVLALFARLVAKLAEKVALPA